MAHTDGFDIAVLDETALADALALSEEAGWNQSAEDWRIFFASGKVYGLNEGGRVVASGAILPYGGFGWISMVLTTKAARGRGIGTAILRQATADLAELGCVPVLDATPAGERIYRPLGFLPVQPLWRWRGTGGVKPARGLPATSADSDWIVARDAEAFGAPRTGLVASLMARAPHLAFVDRGANGFVLGRPGRAATSIGPLVAGNEAAAAALLEAALAATPGPVLIDVPEGRTGIEALLTAQGFAKERPYLRMAQGRAEPFGSPDTLFAIAGPELG